MSEFPPNCVAFVTGAGSGISQAVSKQLISDGIRKIAIIDITAAKLEDTAKLLGSIASDAEVLIIGADCSKESEVDSAIEQTVSRFGRLDVCFNGAGISGTPNPIAEMTTADLDRVLDTNLKGVWYCERAQIRQMIKQEERPLVTGLPFRTRGAIVNAGSLTSHLGLGTLAPYVMAKHAVFGLAKTDTIDYAGKGIRVNNVSPGWIATPMTMSIRNAPAGEAFAARAPMARFGLPEEIAYTVGFLLSDRSSFIAGTSIVVDGGYLCQ